MSYRTVLRKVREHDLEGVPKYRYYGGDRGYGGRTPGPPASPSSGGGDVESGSH